MANDSNAKVTITAAHVGPELEAFIASLPETEYSLIDADDDRYRVTRDGSLWTFEGYTTGWWNYDANLRGYLSTAKGSPSKSLLRRRPKIAHDPYPPSLSGPDERTAWTDLVTALQKPEASLTFFVVDSDVGLWWLSQLSYSITVTRHGGVDWVRSGTIDDEITLENYLRAYGAPLREALSELYLAEDDVDAFVERWTKEHGDAIPTDDEVLAWGADKDTK